MVLGWWEAWVVLLSTFLHHQLGASVGDGDARVARGVYLP